MPKPLLQRIESWEPHYALLVLLVWGLLILLACAGLGILTLSTPPTMPGVAREVGYLAAVNWSVSNALLHYAKSPEKSLFQAEPAFEQQQLDSMVLWPLGYLRLQLLLLVVGIALLSLYYYRIGLYVFGVIAVTLVVKVVKGIRTWGSQ